VKWSHLRSASYGGQGSGGVFFIPLSIRALTRKINGAKALDRCLNTVSTELSAFAPANAGRKAFWLGYNTFLNPFVNNTSWLV